MARPSGTLRVGPYLLSLLGIFVVLYAVVFFPGQRHTPKLGIDLVGGIRVIYTAVGDTNNGQMDVARQIIEDRVNSNGVTGATVQVQGSNQILVLIPNGTGQDVKDIGAAAKLNFRPLVAPAVPVTCGKYAPAQLRKGATSSPSSSPSSGSSPSSSPATGASEGPASTAPATSKAPADAGHRLLAAAPTPSGTTPSTAKTTPSTAKTTPSTAKTSPATTPSSSASTPSQTKAGSCTSTPFAQWQQTNKGTAVPTVDTDFDKLTQTQQSELAVGKLGSDGAYVGGLTNFDCGSALEEPDVASRYYVVCGKLDPSSSQEYAYLLGKVVVEGPQIDDAAAQAPNPGNGSSEWTVRLTLNNTASKNWGNFTTAHNISGLGSSASSTGVSQCSATTVPCADFVAFTLNGEVISSPVTQEPINGGATQISGGWGQDPTGAQELAQQLQFGSLPLTFRLESQQPVSATLGKSQLNGAFLAGGIGLALVVLYSLLYYRGLGLVTIASLLVSAGLVYSLLVILGEHMGYTLDLAGVTGFIVALGITADSFVVFFERIKDEVHEGRSARTAVPRAWVRARRTILSADIVSFLAAAILYFFASADVQGFAFTLGLSTVLDLVVVFLFTHPIVSLFSRSRAFGSARFTGLNAVRTGAVIEDDLPTPRRARGAGGAATAVLEREAETEDATTDEATTDAPAADEAPPSAPRKRSAPSGGTAAERAAARRARLRDEQSDKGDGS